MMTYESDSRAQVLITEGLPVRSRERREEATTRMALTMVDVIEMVGDFAHGGETANNHAWYWLHAGFSPHEAEPWLTEARCFDADAAAMMRRAGITPEQAATRPQDDYGDTETLGYMVANADISVETAQRIIEIEALEDHLRQLATRNRAEN